MNAFEDNYYDNDTFLKTPSRLRYVRTLGAGELGDAARSGGLDDERADRDGQPRFRRERAGRHLDGRRRPAWPREERHALPADGLRGDLQRRVSPIVGDLAPGQEDDFSDPQTDRSGEAAQLKASKNSDDYDYAPEGRIIGHVARRDARLAWT